MQHQIQEISLSVAVKWFFNVLLPYWKTVKNLADFSGRKKEFIAVHIDVIPEIRSNLRSENHPQSTFQFWNWICHCAIQDGYFLPSQDTSTDNTVKVSHVLEFLCSSVWIRAAFPHTAADAITGECNFIPIGYIVLDHRKSVQKRFVKSSKIGLIKLTDNFCSCNRMENLRTISIVDYLKLIWCIAINSTFFQSIDRELI